MAETTKCKMCGDPHAVDHYKGMSFYVCPRTNKVYLIAKEVESVRPDLRVEKDQAFNLADTMRSSDRYA